MDEHRAELTRTGEQFRDAQAAFATATEARRTAVLAAYRAGWTLNDIAEALGADHEPIRRIVRNAGL